MKQCVQCPDPAYVIFEYKNSMGHQEELLCQKHAQELFDKFKHTDLGQAITMSEPTGR